MINLVHSAWLPFRLQDGQEQVLPIAAMSNPQVIDFALPRADFQGAAYQLAIGLLQTLFAPEDEDAWFDDYEKPPSQDRLQDALNQAAHAFNLTGDGPLFMQDFDSLKDSASIPVERLLIGAPREQGIKQNKDHFIKRDTVQVMSLEMAALALFAFQVNGPGIGQGYRTGLRGGGPLTTIIVPNSQHSSLWQKLWLNILHRDYGPARYETPDFHNASVFPWLGPTQISEDPGTEIYQQDVHYLHRYWAMPSRIRLIINNQSAVCSLSGQKVAHHISMYRNTNYGNNYCGEWDHPLTPYKWNPNKKDQEPLPVKGQPGGITYKNWDTLNFSSDIVGQRCATVVEQFESLSVARVKTPRLWAFAYDMDSAKARGWYSRVMPLFHISEEHQVTALLRIKELQQLSDTILVRCRTNIKLAWFTRPKDAKGNMSFIDSNFWMRTETCFFIAVQQLIDHVKGGEQGLSAQDAKTWLSEIQRLTLDLFDEYALSELGNERSMSKRIQARKSLTGWLYGSKDIKDFKSENKITN